MVQSNTCVDAQTPAPSENGARCEGSDRKECLGNAPSCHSPLAGE